MVHEYQNFEFSDSDEDTRPVTHTKSLLMLSDASIDIKHRD